MGCEMIFLKIFLTESHELGLGIRSPYWIGQEKTFFEGGKNLPKYGNLKLHTSRAYQKRYRIRETYDLRLTGTAVSPLGAKAGEMLVAISSHIKGKTK
jgi:hypothetical protein